MGCCPAGARVFPFLFGGTFIEGSTVWGLDATLANFPSFSEGLSLRGLPPGGKYRPGADFPSFSEGLSLRVDGKKVLRIVIPEFPFLFGGTFIEGVYALILSDSG